MHPSRRAGAGPRAGLLRASRIVSLVFIGVCAATVPRAEALRLRGGANPFAKAAAAFQGLLNRKEADRPPQLSEVRAKFEMDKEKLYKIRDQMLLEMQDGLCEGSSSPMLMLPTHITRLPNGKEKGMYLALDLGGTNFRVLKVSLDGTGKAVVDAKKWTVPMELLTAEGEKLFAFLSDCV